VLANQAEERSVNGEAVNVTEYTNTVKRRAGFCKRSA
jgi:hypothetical protein